MLTQAQVKRLFRYDPASGALHGRRSLITSENVRVGDKLYRTSHVIWLWMTGVWPTHTIDHRDTNPHNNSWGNLREATRVQQQANRTSGYGGKLKWAIKQPNGRYAAIVGHKGKRHRAGVFDTEQQAHDAAWLLAQRLHGAFARK